MEQAHVDSKVSEKDAHAREAAAAHEMLVAELAEKKALLKALEDRDRSEAQSKGLAQVRVCLCVRVWLCVVFVHMHTHVCPPAPRWHATLHHTVHARTRTRTGETIAVDQGHVLGGGEGGARCQQDAAVKS